MGTNHKLGSIAAVLVAEGKGILAADDGGENGGRDQSGASR